MKNLEEEANFAPVFRRAMWPKEALVSFFCSRLIYYS